MGISKKRQCVKLQFSDNINLSNVIEEPFSTGKLFKLHAIVEIADYEVMPVEEESSTMFEKYDDSVFFIYFILIYLNILICRLAIHINRFGSVNT